MNSHTFAAERLLYPFGDDEGGFCILASSAKDMALINQCAVLENCNQPIKVVLKSASLKNLIKANNIQTIEPIEIAKLQIPVVVLVSSHNEEESVQFLYDLYLKTGYRFSIYDSYRNIVDITTESCKRRYRKVELDLLPSVVWPTLYTNWQYINYLLHEVVKDRPLDVLDMFAGSGVIGFSIKKESAINSISFAEVNYLAVKSMRSTTKKFPEISGNIYLSEGFSGIPKGEQFDLIIGNPPHHDKPVHNVDSLLGSDPGFEVHHHFFRDAHQFLKPGGEIYFVESKVSGIASFYKRIESIYPQYINTGSIIMQNDCCYIQGIKLK